MPEESLYTATRARAGHGN